MDRPGKGREATAHQLQIAQIVANRTCVVCIKNSDIETALNHSQIILLYVYFENFQ